MPLTGLTWARLKEHIRKYSPVYIAGIVIMLFVSNILYTSTAPRVPAENEVLIYLVDGVTDAEPLNDLAAQALETLQPSDATLQAVNLATVMYSDPEDYNSQMLLMTRMVAGDGDVFLASSDAMQYIVNSEICLPLDEYLESGWMDGLGLEPVYATDEETGETYVAGLSLDSLDVLTEWGVIYNEGACLVIAANGTNQETSMRVIEYMVREIAEGRYVPAAESQTAD